MNERQLLNDPEECLNDGNVSDSRHHYRDGGNGGFQPFAPTTCLSGHDNIAVAGLSWLRHCFLPDRHASAGAYCA